MTAIKAEPINSSSPPKSSSNIRVLAGNTVLSDQPNIPTSDRAEIAIANITPHLKREMQLKGFQWGSPLLIRIFKVPSILEVWAKKGNQYVLFKSYNICKFSGQLGPKTREGDRQSPEGFYHITPRQLNPNSSYYLSFNLGYPNSYDRYHNYTGSALMVHGHCVSVGCYAMTDARISEIYALMHSAFLHGQTNIQVQAYPFALTHNNMNKMRNHRWYSFWSNLKQGYDIFEKTRKPIKVTVNEGKYVLTPTIN